jgi:cytochrome d ubiquinol oxidase subunit II
MLIVLFALFFRPVGFDYRSKLDDKRWRTSWDWALCYAGIVPPLIFGVAIGNLFLGVPMQYDEYLRVYYQGGFFGLLQPFALVAGLLGVALLTMHGAAYLMVRTDPHAAVHQRARKVLSGLALVVFALFGLEGIWLWLGIDGFQITSVIDGNAPANPLYKTVSTDSGSWLVNYTHYPLSIIAPIMGLGGALLAFIMAKAAKPSLALLGTISSVIGIIATAAFSLFPFILPSSLNPNHSLTIWDATSSHLTLNVMLIATLIFLPILIGYTIWCYRALWGKITEQFIIDNDHSLY